MKASSTLLDTQGLLLISEVNSIQTAVKVDDVYCRDCGEDEVYMDIKEEPGMYKVGAVCHGCNRDYGVLDHVSRSDTDHVDEAWEQAEDVVQRYLD